MTKKGSGPRDHRSEPDAEGTSERFRVDRVFATPRAAPATAPPRPAATTPPVKRPTHPPPIGTTQVPAVGRSDTEELSLRRQLARLQHQLAEAQRELATKDEEVAAAVEKRIEIQAAYDVLLEQQREAQQRVAEADAFRARMAGIEERLAAATAEADELRHQIDRERTERAALAVQFDEATGAFDRARNLWRDESAMIDEQHATQLAQLDHQKRVALEAAEAAKAAALDRQREAHEAELEALRTAHERALAALGGELEPKVAEARNLNAEIERLTSELTAMGKEHQNLMTERIELHKWELAQQAEIHADELAAQGRLHAAEIVRLNEEVAAANQAGQLIERNASLREQLWEQTVSTLRESQKNLQQELAAAKEKTAQGDANKWSVEQRLVTTLHAMEKLEAEARELRERLEVAEQESRHSGIDRERFAAYLQEGLVMLGATPPAPPEPSVPPAPAPRVSAPSITPERFTPDRDAGPLRHPSAHERPTAQFAAIVDPPDVELEMEAEAPALPDPREPTRH